MTACPGELELARALGDAGADPAVTAHVEACERCRASCAATLRAIELARALEAPPPSAARREEMRTAILAAGAQLGAEPRAAKVRRAWLVPALACAAAAALLVVVARAPSSAVAPHAHGSVHGQPGARYAAAAGAPDEIVRLEDGAIDVEVEPLHAGERFRVVVGDAEVEVRGTAFSVTARADHLIAVAVSHGRVEVRPVGGEPTLLGAGQSWHVALAAAESAPPAPAVVAAASGSAAPHAVPHAAPRPHARAVAAAEPIAPPAPPPDAPPPAPARGADELAYDRAWTAMRGSDFDTAAAAFARVPLLDPESPLAEDANFWRAVALARAPHRPEAIAAFREFLSAHAASSRAGEASAMLGWILLDTGVFDEAATRFRAALADPKAAIHASARAGLDALEHRAR